ncbi:hypothetical protein A1O3_10454 [Capronia epimyces CBS 606.96]|uniref:Dihydroxyacetone kinase n=1 Tax=Capronia epimyces CBS 606.96 TaxID=1182542 RepID=W9XK03_9EURO|nr:uncharacterized protein A1O3_10454 [Capronia epimyces CBS 606.96]EXJ77296.1 hypothetical protein A1O3_10454 [Capronia epimyces CBS 606.96]
MRTRHFVNDPVQLVAAALKSHTVIRPELRLDADNQVLYAPRRTGQTSIISGGGSGHEPSFTGFVGEGFLSASVAGGIFASPSSRQVLAAIENVEHSEGVLVTVMNYTGDVLNFGVAVEKARARNPALQIETLVVGDDVCVPRSRIGKVGRRGIAGTVLVHKVTGAMAAAGYKLRDVARVGRLVAANLASAGVSLSRVHVPGHPPSQEESGESSADPIELGMGIHNEAGCDWRSGVDAELPAVVRAILRQLLDVGDTERNFLPNPTKDAILLVNNLGALSVLELGAVVSEVADQLRQDYQIRPIRVFAGTFMTSLDGPGFSVSLLNNVDTGVESSLVALLDAPSNVSGWHASTRVSAPKSTPEEAGASPTSRQEATTGDEPKSNLKCDMGQTTRRLRAGLEALEAAEPDVTKYDSVVGDGDCGTTLKLGAEGILRQISKAPPRDIVDLLIRATASVEETMQGTSGALYAIFLNKLTHHVRLRVHEAVPVDVEFWIDALDSALAALTQYTSARPGDRTMMDALVPFIAALRDTRSLKAASQAAQEGAVATKSMRPAFGRTVYIGNEDTWMGEIPDPGAWGLAQFLQGLAS